MRVRRIWVIYSSILMLCLPSLQIEQLQWNGLHIWTQHWLWLSTSLASIRSLCACWWHHWCSVSRLSSSPLANSPPSGTPQVLISFRSFTPCFPGLDTQNRRWIPLSCLKKKKKKKRQQTSAQTFVHLFTPGRRLNLLFTGPAQAFRVKPPEAPVLVSLIPSAPCFVLPLMPTAPHE